MNKNHFYSSNCYWWFLLILLWIGFVPHSSAEKVKLDSSHWGLEEGKECVSCHKKSSAGLTHEWQQSAHATAGVNCLDCHQADSADEDAIEHEGAVIATIVSPKDCGRCHTKEFTETESSVHTKALHSLKSRLSALAGRFDAKAMVDAGCASCHGVEVEVRGDGSLSPESWPNTGIGRINPDGSHGSCSACHGRHRFSKAQARDPNACTWCHTGTDSPDDEVYRSSKHGMLYDSNRSDMNLQNDQWILGKDYSAAPTCVTCHMGATPGVKATHDVGMRDAWNLSGPISERQYLIVFEDGDRRELPESQAAPRRGSEFSKLDGTLAKVKVVATPKRRRQIMSKVCFECHSKGFTKGYLKQFDELVKRYNKHFGRPAQAIMSALYEQQLLTAAPFDEVLELTYWRLWHDEGTAARHGAAMMSPKHTSWQGMLRVEQIFYGDFLAQLRTLAGEEKAAELIDEHVTNLDQHRWLIDATMPNPLMGYGVGKSEHE
jgi:hypothetical protein